METKNTYINSRTTFLRYEQGMAYYALSVPYSEKLYSFPVPISEVQEGTLSAECNTIHMMSYINKAIQEGNLNPEI